MRAAQMKALSMRQQGIALILVLWVAAIVTVIAGSFAYATRTDMNVLQNSVLRARAEAAADAAVHRAIYELYRPGSEKERWIANGVSHPLAWDGYTIQVSLLDESGKIDINTATPELLKGLFAASGVQAEETEKLVDAVQDWRDSDILRRVNGAEEPEYQAAGLKHKPANAPFQTIEELQLVLGMNPDLYRRIAGLITIYSRQPGVNLTIAPREVLAVLPGVTLEQVDAYVAEREAARAAGSPIPSFAAGARFGGAASSFGVSIRADVRNDTGGAFVREAVVRVLGEPKRPYTFLAWAEGTGKQPAGADQDKEVAADGINPNKR
jgi:general secretion pathway protein K